MPEPQAFRRRCRRFLLAVALAALPLAAAAQSPAAAQNPAVAQNPAATEKLPRFVSLRSDLVNLRVGPGETYPIEWVLTKKDMPVEIVKEFQNWRMVRDWQDTKGWVLDRMVSGKRYVVVAGGVQVLHRRPDPSSAAVARAEPGVVARLAECQGAWCRIEAGGYSGWVRRGEVWGVLPDETVP